MTHEKEKDGERERERFLSTLIISKDITLAFVTSTRNVFITSFIHREYARSHSDIHIPTLSYSIMFSEIQIRVGDLADTAEARDKINKIRIKIPKAGIVDPLSPIGCFNLGLSCCLREMLTTNGC